MAGDGLAGNGWVSLLCQVNSRQSSVLHRYGGGVRNRIGSPQIWILGKKKATGSSGGKKTYDIRFYILFEKLSCIFCWNVGTHYIFHLFGLVFFSRQFHIKECPLCLLLCCCFLFCLCCCIFFFPLMESCSELSAKMGIINTSK